MIDRIVWKTGDGPTQLQNSISFHLAPYLRKGEESLIDLTKDFADKQELELESNKLFVQMLDYSRDASGKPAPWEDGCCYLILELALYTLEDYLQDRHVCSFAIFPHY